MQRSTGFRLRRALGGGDRFAAAGIAAVVFLTMMGAGAVLLVAGKLQFPSLGSDAGPLDILRSIGLVGFACLGIPIDIDGLELSVVPLGALGAIAVASAWTARDEIRKAQTWGPADAFKVGAVYAAMMFAAALIFRFGGATPVSVSPLAAAIYGFLWGSVFAGLGWIWHRGAVPEPPAPLRGPLGPGLPVARRLGSGAIFGGLVALLCLVIVRLAISELPRGFGLGDAAAALLYSIAFLPNLLIAIFSLALGGTLEVGAQVDIGGEVIGPVREISLFEWGRGGTPPGLWALLVLPLATSVWAGWCASRGSSQRGPAPALRAVAVGAALFAIGVGFIALVGDARLGAGMVRQRGLALVGVHALEAMLLAFLWSVAGGALGTMLHRKHDERTEGRHP